MLKQLPMNTRLREGCTVGKLGTVRYMLYYLLFFDYVLLHILPTKRGLQVLIIFLFHNNCNFDFYCVICCGTLTVISISLKTVRSSDKDRLKHLCLALYRCSAATRCLINSYVCKLNFNKI